MTPFRSASQDWMKAHPLEVILLHSLQVASSVVAYSSPYFDDIGSKVPKLLTREALDVAQVLISLVTRTRILFLPFFTLLSSSFVIALVSIE